MLRRWPNTTRKRDHHEELEEQIRCHKEKISRHKAKLDKHEADS